MSNKNDLLNKKIKKTNIFITTFFIILLISILLSYQIETYSLYKTYGIINCNETCFITTTIQYDKLNILKLNPKIKYLGKIYDIEKIDYKEPYLNNGLPLQDIELTTNIKNESTIIEFSILYDKQRIITKLKKIIMGEY